MISVLSMCACQLVKYLLFCVRTDAKQAVLKFCVVILTCICQLHHFAAVFLLLK